MLLVASYLSSFILLLMCLSLSLSLCFLFRDAGGLSFHRMPLSFSLCRLFKMMDLVSSLEPIANNTALNSNFPRSQRRA